MINPGLAILALIISGISSIPLFLYLVDGHYQKNYKKAIYYILGFIAFMLIGVLLLKSFGLAFALISPLLIFIFLLVAKALK